MSLSAVFVQCRHGNGGYGVRACTQSTNVGLYEPFPLEKQQCMVPRITHWPHLILILAYGEVVGIPFTDHSCSSKDKSGWCMLLLHALFEALQYSGAMLVVM